MKTISKRRRFHPYTSRKNKKRALNMGGKEAARTGTRADPLAGMGSQLINAMLHRSSQGDR